MHIFVCMKRRILTAALIILFMQLLFFVYKSSDRETLINIVSQGNRRSENLMYVSEYHQNIVKILKNAQELRRSEVFKDPSSFVVLNINKSEKDFSRVKDLELVPGEITGIQKFLAFRELCAFVLIFSVYMMYIVMQERENGMQQYTYTMKHGRSKYLIGISIGIALSVFVFLIICIMTDLLVAYLLYGQMDFDLYIQSLPEYFLYTFPISIREYLLIYTIRLFLAVMTLVCGIWFLFVCIKSRRTVLLMVMTLAAAEYLLFVKISVSDRRGLLRFVNYISILDVAGMDEQYRNVLFWGTILPVQYVQLIVELTMIPSFLLSAAFVYGRTYPSRTIRNKLRRVNSSRVRHMTPYLILESHRILFNRRALFMLGFLLLSFHLVCVKTSTHYSDYQKELDLIYWECGGEYETFYHRVTELKEANEKMRMEMAEIQKTMQADGNYYEYSGRLNALQLMLDSNAMMLTEFNEKLAQYDYVYKRTQIQIAMLSDRGYDEAVAEKSVIREWTLSLILIIMSIAITGNAMYRDKDGGMYALIRSSRMGSSGVYRRRLLLCVSFIMVLGCCLFAFDIVEIENAYGIYSWKVPIQSVGAFREYKGEMTVLMYFTMRACFIISLAQLAFSASILLNYAGVKTTFYAPVITAALGVLSLVVICSGQVGIVAPLAAAVMCVLVVVLNVSCRLCK